MTKEWSQVGQNQEDLQLETPKQYQVVMLNDDFTPMDFVVAVLEQYFGKSTEEAQAVMMDVHTKGSATCGCYTKDLAESKVLQVTTCARRNGHPLCCTAEPV